MLLKVCHLTPLFCILPACTDAAEKEPRELPMDQSQEESRARLLEFLHQQRDLLATAWRALDPDTFDVRSESIDEALRMIDSYISEVCEVSVITDLNRVKRTTESFVADLRSIDYLPMDTGERNTLGFMFHRIIHLSTDGEVPPDDPYLYARYVEQLLIDE